jgi:hydrogenase maturation protease
MKTGSANTLIIGVGNLYRCDDGAGLCIASRLREFVPAGVTVLEESGEGAALLEAWKGATAVILVDAVQSGAPPGIIHRIDTRRQQIPSRFFHYSSHAFGVGEAIEMARVLHLLPPSLLLYGIEGRNFSEGIGLSEEVEHAAAAVLALALDDVRSFLAAERAASEEGGPYKGGAARKRS